METRPQKIAFPFLQGAGEMGELTRRHNWSQTSLGPIESWPQSLCTTLGIVLHSAFPMFLFWGKDLVCFYNDAFRPSLGAEGKHPSLGKKGQEVWPEIWDIIGPLIHKVMTTGEPVYFEDRLVPFYRNGKLEEIYWTFSYSPAYGDDGKINGVFVTCTETTQKVLQAQRLEKNVTNLHNIIFQSPVAMCILRGPEFIVEVANDKMLDLWGKPAEALLYKPIFEGLTEAKGQGFEELLRKVYYHGETIRANAVPVNLPRKDGIQTVYINFVYEAYREENGDISGVMAVANVVTEEILASRKIADSEQRLRSVIENAPFPIGIYTGREMRIALVNQAILDAWGKGPDVIGKLYSEVLPELASQQIYQQLAQVFETGQPYNAKNRRVDLKVDGELRSFYFNYVFTPLFDALGNVYGVMNTAADVTDLNVAKQQVEESEQRFRLLADAMPQFVWASDKDGNVNYYNRATLEYTGKTVEQLSGDGWLGIIHPDEKTENIARWKHSIETGEVMLFQHRFRNRNGEYRWQLTRAIPQRDAEGNIQMWIGTSTDIHENKLFEEELTHLVQERTRELENSKTRIESSEERLRSVFNAAQSGMFIFAPVKNVNDEVVDFRFVITNPMFASYVGQQPEALNGEPGSKWFPGYLHNGVFDMYKKTYLTGESQRIDIHYNVDQHDLYLDLQSIKMGEEVLVTFTDYTPLKTAQLQLEKTVEDLKRSNTNLEDFAYAASHDMKEPIRKIHFFSDKIRNSLSDRFHPEELRYFERMESAAQRMGTLIDDLLSYSRVSIRPRIFEEVDLNQVIATVITDLELEIEQKKADVIVDPLPVIQGHKRQVQQAFQNLISNALKFQEDGRTPVVRISSRIGEGAEFQLNLSFEEQQKRFHVIEVKDNGIGFEQSEAERIFNVFTRLHGNAEYRGTGVGLSIVRKVAENHHGYVIAKSEAGKGSCFTILFPA